MAAAVLAVVVLEELAAVGLVGVVHEGAVGSCLSKRAVSQSFQDWIFSGGVFPGVGPLRGTTPGSIAESRWDSGRVGLGWVRRVCCGIRA